MLRTSPEKYKEMIKKDLQASKADIPEGYVMPTAEEAYKTVKEVSLNMDDWADSDDEGDFGSGSDCDEDMEVDEASGLSGSEAEEEEEDDD